MRILCLSHYFPPEGNAPASRTYEHCVRWVRAGHEVTVVTGAPSVPTGIVYDGYRNGLRPQRELMDGIRVVRVWTLLAANRGFARRTLSYVSYLVTSVLCTLFESRPDVLIATSPQFFCGWAGVIAARLRRVPLVLEVRDLWPASIVAAGVMREGFVTRRLEWLECLMYRAATHIVTVGDGYRKGILAKVDRPETTTVITNGADLREFQPRTPDRDFSAEWGLEGKFVCGYVGALGMSHGLEVVVEAARLLKERGRDDVRFCLIGDGARRSRLQAMAREAGVDERVVFTGLVPRSRVPGIIASCDACLVHLMGVELFASVIPSKMFETMAMARPIILGLRGEAAELIREAGAGLVIQPDSAIALADAVETLVDDAEGAERLGRSGRSYVTVHHDRDGLASRYLELLQRVVGALPTPSTARRPPTSGLVGLERPKIRTRTGDIETVKESAGRPALPSAVKRWWYALRYYRFSQMAHRAMKLVRLEVRRRVPALRHVSDELRSLSVRANPGFAKLLASREAELAHGGGAGRAQSADGGERRPAHSRDDVLHGRLCFLNETRKLDSPFDWSPEGATRQWRFHLHYHEFLLHLIEGRPADQDPRDGEAWAIIGDWIAENPVGEGPDAWHPYCISRRLPVWMALWHAVPPSGETGKRVLRSLVQQVRSLLRDLELDVRGNHLFENTKALALSGAFFEGPEADHWLTVAERLWREQCLPQIRDDGEHFERVPTYQALFLRGLLDMRDAVRAVRPELAEECSRTARRMAEHLGSMLHPDGNVPLFGDSALDATPPPRSLMSRIGPSPKKRVTEDDGSGSESARSGGATVGDYWIWRDSGDFLVFDAGKVGADELPAHAHCDLLSFEMSLGGRRVVVDSGTFDYETGEMRQYCRSTGAHNVLQLEGVEQCDVWSRFRMGYRGWPTTLMHGAEAGFDWCCATHNAYRRAGVGECGRWIACRPAGPWFVLDWCLGPGEHRAVSRLHLHPEVDARLLDASSVELTVGGSRYRLWSFGGARVRLEPAWYCPEFGRRLQSTAVCQEGTAPGVLAWALSTDAPMPPPRVGLRSDGRPRLQWEHAGTTLVWDGPDA